MQKKGLLRQQVSSEDKTEVKKLVSVLLTATSMIDTREEALERVFCIYYLVWFKKDTDKIPVQALINSRSEINAIDLSFAKQLGLPIRPTNIGAQKIDVTTLNTHGMVVAAFLVVEKANQVRFLKRSF